MFDSLCGLSTLDYLVKVGPTVTWCEFMLLYFLFFPHSGMLGYSSCGIAHWFAQRLRPDGLGSNPRSATY